MIERGTGFVANIIAARLGGAAVFGQYSLAISTANNIATYAGAGIGSTAARFSGKYPYEQPGYRTLARVLTFVSIVSALVAGVALWLGSSPIAHLLGKDSLVGLLHWSALSAMGIILLECARGFFVGQRRLSALIVLSLIVGVGMLSLVPYAALRHSPAQMITFQGAITTSAVLVCLMLARPLHLVSQTGLKSRPAFRSVLREVWGFGLVQLAGLAGANAAGWWLVTLVARTDSSFVQMGFFGIASQLRNIVGLAPGLLTEGSFAVMADPSGQTSNTPERVLGFTTFVASLLTFLLAASGIVLAPWILRILYSNAYAGATAAVSFALALAVMHMGNAPASARLSIVSIRSSAVINTAWAIFVALTGTLVMLHVGSAAMAMIIYLAAHTLSSACVLITLAWKDTLPEGLITVFTLASTATIALASLGVLRDSKPDARVLITFAMLILSAAVTAALLAMGRRYAWLPTRDAFRRLLQSARASFANRGRRQANVS
jgi:O-antigen/teichoic acid export membrane protein